HARHGPLCGDARAGTPQPHTFAVDHLRAHRARTTARTPNTDAFSAPHQRRPPITATRRDHAARVISAKQTRVIFRERRSTPGVATTRCTKPHLGELAKRLGELAAQELAMCEGADDLGAKQSDRLGMIARAKGIVGHSSSWGHGG